MPLDPADRAYAELRRLYNRLIDVYDTLPLERLNARLPEAIRYRSKAGLLFRRMIQIAAVSEFALAAGLLTVDEVRRLQALYEDRRPDIFLQRAGDLVL